MTADFGAAVARIRASMGAEDPWTLPETAEPKGPSAEQRARRRMGLEAYTRAMEARGMSGRSARIWATALPLFQGLDDD
jgi:hypothetical protein